MSKLGKWWRKREGDVLYGYSWLVHQSAHWHFHGWENLAKAQKSKRPLIWSLWHQQVWTFILLGDRFLNAQNFNIIIVGDDRSDIIARMAHHVGSKTRPVDMSGNPMASGRAVLDIIKSMKEGMETILAPDGPDGPAFEAKPGIAFLAKKAKAVVLPVGIWAKESFQLNRWDHYLVPLPLCNFHVYYGEPIFVGRKDEQESVLERVSIALTKAREKARQLAGEKPE